MPMSVKDLESWESVCSFLKGDLGEAAFSSWIAPLSAVLDDHGHVTITAPSRYVCDRVQTDFGGGIRDAWRSVNPSVRRITYQVKESRGSVALDDDDDDEVDVEAAAAGGGAIKQPPARACASGALGPDTAPLNPRYSFESFVVGRPNEFAHAAATRVAEDAKAPFNPLFIHGDPGLGKTHLMHAIARRRKERFPAQKVLFVPSETFLIEFLSALQSQSSQNFKHALRDVDMLLVDDIHWLFGKTRTQEEFFHTFNALVDRGKHIVVSSEKSPMDLSGLTDRLRSRLSWGLVADLHPTDYELRRGILETKLAETMKNEGEVGIDPKVLDFMAHRIVSGVRTLEGALKRVVAQASLFNQTVTIELAQRVLQDVLRHSDRKVSIEEIQRKVAAHYDIKLSEMYSPNRQRAVARPRQIAMYLCKSLTQRSLPEIGSRFGGRDHTTVMHAIRRVTQLRQTDSAIDEDVERLRRSLEG